MDLEKGATGRIRDLRTVLAGLSEADVLRVLSDFSLEAAAGHGFADSTDFDLVHEGKIFPPKAVLGLAATRVIGRPLTSDEFSGGERSACFQILRGLGFVIQPKAHIALEPDGLVRSSAPPYPFEVGRDYVRSDIFKIVGFDDPGGGNMYTGYASHGDDWFIFCGVGVAGRTGHDYGNHFDGNELIWYGKTNASLKNASVQSLLAPKGRVYIFYRDDNRKPFKFAGIGTPKRVRDTKPVEVTWAISLPTETSGALPEEIEAPGTVYEGAKKTITVNAYERDRTARDRCIAHWGCECIVCGFDFGKRYGATGVGFIHVHHLKPISEIGEQYRLDPVQDLRPVCPNCHAMLHRSRAVLSIEQLQNILQSQAKT